MIRHYTEQTLGDLVLRHKNDYGFTAAAITLSFLGRLPNLSIVIPYYEARHTINQNLWYIFQAIRYVRAGNPKWEYEITVVDDGSKSFPAKKYIQPTFRQRIEIITVNSNQGCYYARNLGLIGAKKEIVFFVDSDVFIGRSLIFDHLRLHGFCNTKKKGCISFGLFYFLDFPEYLRFSNTKRKILFSSTNDFRWECKYLPSWIGCKEDKQFIGHVFRPMMDTHYLRQWPNSGIYGPWLITNMVLGGCFAVNRSRALSVGGFSNIFGKYGFEETSLVTKLVALCGDYIIPLTTSFAIHVNDVRVALSPRRKISLFRRTHNLYFNHYLKTTIGHIQHERN